jgi:hypothetical protein
MHCVGTARSGDADVTAPLDGARRGRLVLSRGTPNLAVSSDRTLDELARAHFDGLVPAVDVRDGMVAIRYPGGGIFGWPRHAFRAARADVALNPAVPWSLEFGEGVQRISADLRELDLTAVEVRGGLGRAELWLPRPSGTVSISFRSIGALHLHRPPGTSLRVSIRGGISSLSLDGEELGGIGGGIRRETPGWAGAPDRYDVVVRGGVSHVAIGD